MKRLRKPLLLTILVLALLSVKSYAQDTQAGASSLPNVEARQELSFDDAAKLVLDTVDAAEAYIAKLEAEGVEKDKRLEIEKEKTKLLDAIKVAQGAQIVALQREKEATGKIEKEHLKIIAAQDKRIKKLEKSKGGFFKGFASGVGVAVLLLLLL